MQISDNLFLSLSKILGVRVTPDNIRVKMKDLASTGGVTAKIKTDTLVEILVALHELEKKINEK